MNSNQMPQNGNMTPDNNNGDNSNIPEKPAEENNQNVTQENSSNS